MRIHLNLKMDERIIKSFKQTSVMFLVLMFSLGIYFIKGTNAFHTDSEANSDNTFVMGQLDIEVFSNDAGFVPTAKAEDLEIGEAVLRQVTVSNAGTIDVKYKVEFEQVSGNDELCDGLDVMINDGSSDIYTGLLSGLDYEFSAVLVSGLSSDYVFKVSLPSDADSDLVDMECSFDFVFSSWQGNFIDDTQGWIDEEKLENNKIESGEWLSEGDVVINEVMWMGSDGSAADEWIELRNMTNSAINLSDWYIENAAVSGGNIVIPSGEIISVGGVYLIANYDKSDSNSDLDVDVDYQTTAMSLADIANGDLILKSDDGLMIDSAKSDNWPAGESGSSSSDYKSMQRNPIPGDGMVPDNWFTVNHPNANSIAYWDSEINNYGTPGSDNLLPVVLNEFVANPSGDDTDSMPDGEFIELWNNDSEDWDVGEWVIVNGDGDKITISSSNSDNDGDVSDGGETIVPAGDDLVIYVDGQFGSGEFFDNSSDGKLYLYAEYGDLEIGNDYYAYSDPSGFGEGKAYQRMPDGVGPWVDPKPKPGEENELSRTERDYYRAVVFEKCFDEREFNSESEYPLCKGIFLEYLGLLDDQYDDKMPKDVYAKMLEKTITDEDGDKNNKDEEDNDVENNEEEAGRTVIGVEADKVDEGEEQQCEEEEGIVIGAEEQEGEEADVKEVGDDAEKVGEGDVEESILEEGNAEIEKEIDIKLKGELNIEEGFTVEIKQEIKEIIVSGEAGDLEGFSEAEIDLDEMDKIDEVMVLKIKIENLDIPSDFKMVSNDEEDVILEIKVVKKKMVEESDEEDEDDDVEEDETKEPDDSKDVVRDKDEDGDEPSA